MWLALGALLAVACVVLVAAPFLRDPRPADDSLGQPAPGLPAAMFPPPALNSSGAPGQVEISSSIGKTLRLDRTTSLSVPIAWTPVQTQTLIAPTWIYQEPPEAKTNASFYRAVWLK